MHLKNIIEKKNFKTNKYLEKKFHRKNTNTQKKNFITKKFTKKIFIIPKNV